MPATERKKVRLTQTQFIDGQRHEVDEKKPEAAPVLNLLVSHADDLIAAGVAEEPAAPAAVAAAVVPPKPKPAAKAAPSAPSAPSAPPLPPLPPLPPSTAS
ncbi:MAG TPA: hypothetical protein VHB20_14675 [Verrucomicrobiae bacterium]|jgi:hypothetical protein|nr:hypothetical protein [Verrucomicrobiae bacterium]